MTPTPLAEGSSILSIDRDLVKAIRAVFECQVQGASDFCGEQREFHLPRMQEAFFLLTKHFPKQAGEAMATAKDGWGDPI